MANTSSQVRQKLLVSTLDAVKKCQVQYGGRTELATGQEENVLELCKQVELILIHGLRDRDDSLGLAVIRNVRELVGGGEGVARNLWNLLKTQISQQEQQRFLLLNHITTDQGRARAWIRSSLNEQSLERFLESLLREKRKLVQLYEDWAFMRDDERAGMLPTIASGLTSVRFALKIDDPSLNSELEGMPQVINSLSSLLPSFKGPPSSAGNASSGLPSTSAQSQPQLAQDEESEGHVITTSKVRARVKKKKTKAAAQVVDLDQSVVVAEVAEEAADVAADIYSPFASQSATTDDSFLFPATTTTTEKDVGSKPVNSENAPGNPFTSDAEPSNPFTSDTEASTYPTSLHSSARQPSSSSSAEKRSSSGSGRSAVDRVSRASPRSSLSSVFTTDDNRQVVGDEDSRDQLSRLTLSYEPVKLGEAVVGKGKGSVTGSSNSLQDEIDIYSQFSASDKKSDAGSDSSSQFGTALTPVTNKTIGALFPVHPGSSCRTSLHLESFDRADLDYASPSPSPSQDSEQATQSKLLVSNGGDNISTCSGLSSRSNPSLGRDDLRKALLSVMEKKEELESQIKSLRSSYEAECNSTRDLKLELENVTQTKQEQIEKLDSRNTILSRENELLKHQLKKYVGAVQKLRDGPQAYETLARLESQNDSNEINNKYVDYHYEASEYEKKLIQVAEMHGELLEFNETLQKSVQTRDNVICRLRAELVELRGPLPEDQDNWDSSSLASSFSEVSVSTSRVLVNIWIPSVFMTGSGSNKHHVYQVYVRIRDTEWNVYRRYNQFLELHHNARRSDPIVASFHFPPKRHLGNRSERFVESRRILLQTYLRNIVNYMVGTHPSLSNCPDKETLVSILPFFSDAPDLSAAGTADDSGGTRRSRGSLTRVVL